MTFSTSPSFIICPQRIHSPLCSIINLAAQSHALARPITPQLNHVVIVVWQIDTETSKPLNSDVTFSHVGNINAPDNGIILGEDGV